MDLPTNLSTENDQQGRPADKLWSNLFPGVKAPATRQSQLTSDKASGTSPVTRCVIAVQHGEAQPNILVHQCVCGYTVN